MKLDITKEDLETMATRSLEGLLFSKGIIEPCAVTLRFEQSTMEWRRRHDGPDTIIIPEFVPMCLCESIANLARKGFAITIESFQRDPVTK